MNYLDQQINEYENSLSHPDKMWVVMFPDDPEWKNGNWSDPTTDRYEAEQIYWRAKDMGEDVSIGYFYEGNWISDWRENLKEFREVRI